MHYASCSNHPELLDIQQFHQLHTCTYKSQILNLAVKSRDFCWCNILSLCILVPAVLFFSIFVSLSIFAQSDSHSLLLTVDAQICLVLELWEAAMWTLI